MSQPLYIVTGRNRLTGLRERCSMAAPKDVAEQLMAAWKRLRVHNKAYTHLKLESYNLELQFKPTKK